MAKKPRIWETPKEGNFGNSIYNVKDLVEKYKLQIDVCCTPENRVKECPAFFSLDVGIDGLKQEWILNGWMNPMHFEQEKWVRKAIESVIKHGITMVCLLRVDTSIIYFRNLVMGIDTNDMPVDIGCHRELHYIEGRVKYWENGAPLPPHDRPPFASCLCIYEPRGKNAWHKSAL